MPYAINPVTGEITKITKAQKGAYDDVERSRVLESLLGSSFGVPTLALSILLPVTAIVVYLAAEKTGEGVIAFLKQLVTDVQDLRATGKSSPTTGPLDIFIATLLEVTGITKTPD